MKAFFTVQTISISMLSGFDSLLLRTNRNPTAWFYSPPLARMVQTGSRDVAWSLAAACCEWWRYHPFVALSQVGRWFDRRLKRHPQIQEILSRNPETTLRFGNSRICTSSLRSVDCMLVVAGFLVVWYGCRSCCVTKSKFLVGRKNFNRRCCEDWQQSRFFHYSHCAPSLCLTSHNARWKPFTRKISNQSRIKFFYRALVHKQRTGRRARAKLFLHQIGWWARHRKIVLVVWNRLLSVIRTVYTMSTLQSHPWLGDSRNNALNNENFVDLRIWNCRSLKLEVWTTSS